MKTRKVRERYWYLYVVKVETTTIAEANLVSKAKSCRVNCKLYILSDELGAWITVISSPQSQGRHKTGTHKSDKTNGPKGELSECQGSCSNTWGKTQKGGDPLDGCAV